uniref:C2 Aida-type domain-containing protein n=1 Tax=Globisporangium ultimum (strain ATCC 200006 / CBS 805.95 / DAOM BR144) TaxID=431595 RepID=K3WDJ8_GLOUD
MDEQLTKRHAAWCSGLQRAIETDGWGQVVEAVEAYERLAAQLTQEASQFHQLSKDQSRTIEKVAGSLDLRVKCLSAVDGERASPTKDDMEDVLEVALDKVLESVLSDTPQVFPLDLGAVARRRGTKASTVQVVEEADDLVDDESLTAAATAAAAARRPRRKGETYLDLFLDKIGLKDASTYTNPTLVISVIDRDGNAMEEKHETFVGSCSEPQHVSFHARIQLETSLKDMDERGAAIFFEFYHYKPKKRKQSCRCWTLLEMDEVAAAAADSTTDDGSNALVLELYQKPMDPKRKRIHLFTVKELYLHLQLTHKTTP